MRRYYFSARIADFLAAQPLSVLGQLAAGHEFPLEQPQRDAWLTEIEILQQSLQPFEGSLYFEYSIPRMGKRIDVLLLIGSIIFVLEFKVGEADFPLHAIDQVWDYALDLKNFHQTSHEPYIAPILVATSALSVPDPIMEAYQDKVLFPIRSNAASLTSTIRAVLSIDAGNKPINAADWEQGRYEPTPTIVEAAMALYGGHSVQDISRSDASAINLQQTSEAIADIIKRSAQLRQKSICFVTGVPGAGKTLVGLNVATQHIDKENDLYSVFLSGNGPLVAVLREALARDRVRQQKELGLKIRKGDALRDVKLFIQNVHNFRDDCLVDPAKPPLEHVALFDEAQRAWDLEQTANFMLRRKNVAHFAVSEPEFLISCLDRHPDWAVVVCLVGGGQEINTGEAGISEWVRALRRSFAAWHIYISPRLNDTEYGAGSVLEEIKGLPNVYGRDELHLSVSMRSFRAENVSLLVKQLLDLDAQDARRTLAGIHQNYPILLTRDLTRAKEWIRKRARGSERYGIVASSQAQRLKPHAIDVRSPVDPIHWFLDGKEDVRSSYYMEDVVTEFQVQGLELDWACVTWDADFRFTPKGWEHWSFVGDRWNRVKKTERQVYLKNAYRVLLTRARQGMVIVVPEGSADDPTRSSRFYDATFDYLRGIGFQSI